MLSQHRSFCSVAGGGALKNKKRLCVQLKRTCVPWSTAWGWRLYPVTIVSYQICVDDIDQPSRRYEYTVHTTRTATTYFTPLTLARKRYAPIKRGGVVESCPSVQTRPFQRIPLYYATSRFANQLANNRTANVEKIT